MPLNSGIKPSTTDVGQPYVDRCLSFCTFSFGHCVVGSSSIYGFSLPLPYLQTLLMYQGLQTKSIVYVFTGQFDSTVMSFLFH